jgi:hypothetical protein
LSFLSKTHILRFKFNSTQSISSNSYEYRKHVLEKVPLIWTLDDDYIPASVLKTNFVSECVKDNTVWNEIHRYYDREVNLICATRSLPCSPHLIDFARLDVLLEDYLDEVCYYNKYCKDNGSNNQIAKQLIHIPVNKILFADHSIRLDLSAVLTLAITIDIPTDIFVDGLLSRLGTIFSKDEILGILSLPLFAKTALVSLIRRTCRKEVLELQAKGFILDKSRFPIFFSNSLDFESAPTFEGESGYRHLKGFKKYLNLSDIQFNELCNEAEECKHSVQFTDLEIELLKILPDFPTRIDSNKVEVDGKKDTYNSWVSLAARHSVVLISRSERCPSLTKAPTSKAKQDDYIRLLPILQVARMSYNDLEVASTGPAIDGRTRAGVSKASKHLGSKVLKYGAGIPGGDVKSLSWNAFPVLSTFKRHSPADLTANIQQPSVILHDMTDDISALEDKNDIKVVNDDDSSLRIDETMSSQLGSILPEREQSSPKPIKILNAVSGFSADVDPNASFLLAPQTAIQDHNRYLDDTLGWRSLESPPVVLHVDNTDIITKQVATFQNTDDKNIEPLLNQGQISLSRSISDVFPFTMNRKEFTSKVTKQQVNSLLKEMGTLRNTKELSKFNNDITASVQRHQKLIEAPAQKKTTAKSGGYLPESSIFSVTTKNSSNSQDILISRSLNNLNWMKSLARETKDGSFVYFVVFF